MNVIYLMGGIGNQMFQYAFGKAQEHNGATVCFDKEFYRKAKSTDKYPRFLHIDKFKTHLTFGRFVNTQKTYSETHNKGYEPQLLQVSRGNFMGYWQYYKYFKEILPLLREELILREEYYTEDYLKIRDEVTQCNSIAIHVRRGDYLTHRGIFRNLRFGYYVSALTIYKDYDKIFIFSDDIPWCREKFKSEFFEKEIKFIDLNEYLSFDLMRLCKHHIIANSTFSYWAAILKDDPDQIVVCPKEWLVNIEQDDGNEVFFPEQWIKIEGNVVSIV